MKPYVATDLEIAISVTTLIRARRDSPPRRAAIGRIVARSLAHAERSEEIDQIREICALMVAGQLDLFVDSKR